MFTFSSIEIRFVVSLISPILSMPLMLTLARNEASLCIVHLTGMILFPSLDISLTATGHFGLCTTIELFRSIYPTTSSPGIGLQHCAIAYESPVLSIFSRSRYGWFLSIGAAATGVSFSTGALLTTVPTASLQYFLRLPSGAFLSTLRISLRLI